MRANACWLTMKLLFTGAMLLSIGAAQAEDDSDYPAYERRGCVAKFCFDDEDQVELTPAEQERSDHLKARMARIIADAGERMEQQRASEEAEAKAEAAREAVRRSQCTVPIFWINCPPKEGAE